MTIKAMGLAVAVAVLGMAGAANAALLKISATSAAAGPLGFFVVDDAVLAADPDKRLVASQFADYYFADPGSAIVLDQSNVDGDTGGTDFSFVGGVWTVTGGGGDSLTDSDLGTRVWIAGDDYLDFGSLGGSYSDVSWSTMPAGAVVPLPAAMPLLAAGLSLLSAVGLKRRRARIA